MIWHEISSDKAFQAGVDDNTNLLGASSDGISSDGGGMSGFAAGSGASVWAN
jgi:hypothetical protein